MPGSKKKKKGAKRERKRGSATAPGAELRRRELAAQSAARVAGAPRASSLQAAVTAVSGSGGADGRTKMHPSLRLLQMKYASLGKAEWWWIFDDSLAAIARVLKRDAFVVLDHFILPDQVRVHARAARWG